MCLLPECPQKQLGLAGFGYRGQFIGGLHGGGEEVKSLASLWISSVGLVDGWVVSTRERESLQADGRAVEKMNGWEELSVRQGGQG